MKLKLNTTYFIVLPIIFGLGFLLQLKLQLNSDVTWLLHITCEWMKGAKYGIDIFETNPPMILFINFPAVFLANQFSWNLDLIFICYIFLLKAIVVSFVCTYLTKILPDSEKLIRNLLIIVIILSLIFIPLYSFGQRDCLWLALSLPYIFAAMLFLQNKKIPIWQAIVVGIFAGVGFGLKPYFLFTLGFVEIYIIYCKRRFFAGLRVETIIIASIFFLYLLYIQFYQPGYFQIILPLVRKYYFSTVSWGWWSIFSHVYVLIPILALLFYVYFRDDDKHPVLGHVLALSLAGGILSVVSAKTIWYYHVVPALFFMIVLNVYIATQIIRSHSFGSQSWKNTIIPISVVALLLFPVVFLSFGGLFSIVKNPEKIAKFIDNQNKPNTLLGISLVSTNNTIGIANFFASKYVSGVPFYWWYGGLLKAQIKGTIPLKILKQDYKFFVEINANEIEKYKPHWVVVYLYNPYQYGNRKYARHEIFYFDRMMLNKKFYAMLKKYRFYKLIAGHVIYERI